MRNVLSLLWSLTLPLRQPLAHKVHATIDQALAPLMQHLEHLQRTAVELTRRLGTIETRLAEVNQKLATAQTSFEENLHPTLEGVVRDLARFEAQIECLKGSVSSMKRIDYSSSPLDKDAA